MGKVAEALARRDDGKLGDLEYRIPLERFEEPHERMMLPHVLEVLEAYRYQTGTSPMRIELCQKLWDAYKGVAVLSVSALDSPPVAIYRFHGVPMIRGEYEGVTFVPIGG